VEHKIEQQAEFVRWWRETVQRAGQPEKNSPGSARILSLEAAEEHTGITHQQVSKVEEATCRTGMRTARSFTGRGSR